MADDDELKDGEERHSDDVPLNLSDDDLPEAEEGIETNEDGVESLDVLAEKEEEEEDALDLAFEEEVDAF